MSYIRFCACLRILVSNKGNNKITELRTDSMLCCSSTCVPYVASFSGLSISDCPFGIL